MDTDTADELEQLRFRAYGPSADIHTDPAAQERLRELEYSARPVDAVTPDEADAQPDAEASHTSAASHGSDPAQASEPDEPIATAGATPLSHRRLSRTVRLIWAASIVVAIALTAAATYGLVAMTPVSLSSGAPQIATLQPESLGKKVPPGWFGAGPSSRMWEFYGLTLFETSSGTFGETGGDCLMLVTTADVPEEGESADNWSLSALSAGGCSMGAFPLTLEIAVDSNAPEELRAAYPNSVIQFVKRGDDIGVFLDKG